MPPDAIESFIIRWENSGAAATDWSGVEPSIFGTLLTRATSGENHQKCLPKRRRNSGHPF
jgi:hypothetical protein